ncbi:Fucose permease [Izhakiella capsodis]|uniref:Fucose permease n=1 Tax=Izhakiella capsodis TaxID=1367852 RepID=A0A1I4YTZ1_9GAMM|nr:MFS transporter [Izhakiella capsodis]SFN41504.1 Fucose permease [Izhakiella capsodis]
MSKVSSGKKVVSGALATRAVFFIVGMAVGLWAALVPFVQQRTGAEANQLGALLLCLGAGSLVSMSVAGPLVGRFGCRTIIFVATLLYCLLLPVLATADELWQLGLALFIFGMGIGLTEVAMNVQGAIVEQMSGKPLMSGFHCLWSIGGIAGSAGGALLFRVGLTPLTSTLLTITVTALVLLLTSSGLLRFGNHHMTAATSTGRFRPGFTLILLALMTMLSFMAEGAVIDWSGIFMTTERGLDVRNAGWSFAVFSIAMSVLRLTGDALVERLGRKTVLVGGGVLAMAGYLLVVLAPDWIISLWGFALIGIGAANIVPILVTLAGQEKGMPVNLSVAVVTTLGYFGVLGGPAILGWIAHYTNFQIAFTLLAAGFALIAVAALTLRYQTN